MEDFTAMDFETAQSNPASICQVGLVRVESGQVVDEVNKLVRPPNNFYFAKNVEVHGIQPSQTENAPTFDIVWHQIKHLIQDQVIVAHNIGFDVGCLRSALAYYEEVQPDIEERCTRRIFGRGLAYLSKKYKIPLQHHDALSDAHACAQLYMIHQRRLALPKTGKLF